MKRLIVLAILVVILASFLSSGIADTSASTTDTSVPDNELASGGSKIEDSNSSASATITITMNALPDE